MFTMRNARNRHLMFADAPGDQGGSSDTGQQPDSAPDDGQEVDWQAQAAHWKAMSRKNEDRAKSNAEKARKFDELEEQTKSELQKALDRAADAEKRATDFEVKALRASIGAKNGVDPDLLAGSTEEEITEYAQRLLAWKGTTNAGEDKHAASSANHAGERGEKISGPRQLSRDDLKNMTPQQINKARKDGQLDELMGI